MDDSKIINFETLLKCSCSDCGISRQRGCNSSRLKVMLGDLFDEELSIEKYPGLFCRKKPQNGQSRIESGTGCLCPGCEMGDKGAGFYCSGE
jgi:hypothetical protein